jgi:hypothetical protein
MSDLRTEGTGADQLREMEARVARRLGQAERENERLRRRMGLVLAAAGLAVVASAASLVLTVGGTPSVSARSVETRELVLRDDAGRVRARLGTTAEGVARLALVDRDGRARLRMSLLADGSPGVTFSDAAGRTRAVLGVLPDQTTSLVIADPAGRTRTVLGYSPDESVTLVFADREGTTRAALGVEANGAAGLTLVEDAGRAVAPVLEPLAETFGEGEATGEPGPPQG